MFPKTLKTSVLGAFVLSIGTAALAHPLPLGLLSGDSGWEASTDQLNWIPAYSGYPNPITSPRVIDAMGQPTGAHTGQLMWYWSGNALPSGMSGPEEVYLRRNFDFSGDAGAVYGLYAAADDWMEISINGLSLGEYLLTDYLNQDNQPEAKLFEVMGSQLTIGSNSLVIHAKDGGSVASDLLYEWVFVDSVNNQPMYNPIEFVRPVPEPGSLALAGLSLAAVLVTRRRTPRS